MKVLASLLIAFSLLAPNIAFAAEDKAIKEQRREAAKQRQQQKNQRNIEIREASKEFREYARELKKQYTEQARDFDTDYRIQQAELQAEQSSETAIAEAELQEKIMQLFLNPQNGDNEGSIDRLKDDMQQHTQRLFEIRKKSALVKHQHNIDHELKKHRLMSERDQDALNKAEELGLRGEYSPIIATAIGDGLSKQEETWNQRELKEVKKLSDANQRLFAEFLYGAKLREWEIQNRRDDFDLRWQKEAELHQLNSELSFFNSLSLMSSDNTPEDQQALTRRMTELNKQNRLINIKYKKYSDQNRIRRKEEKRKIMGR